MSAEQETKEWVVIGLGNPGRQYEKTRHNIGFMVVSALAQSLGCVLKAEARWPGAAGRCVVNGVRWHVLMPTTYMNNSGEAVRRYLDYHRLTPESIVAVIDDVALEFGELRLRKQGSPGGHNGLKSLQAHIGTDNYKRLRMGISDRLHGDLADYVLAPFSAEEREKLPEFIHQGVNALLALATESFDNVMTLTNKKKVKEKESQEIRKTSVQENKKDESESKTKPL